MKRITITLILIFVLGAAASFAQEGNPFAPYGYHVKTQTSILGRSILHDKQVIVPIGSAFYNTKTKTLVGVLESDSVVVWLGSNEISMYVPILGIFTTPDPMAEKYYHISPYAYVRNNPILRIDPDGLTDYTFDRRSGDIQQVGATNNDPDRVLRTYQFGKHKGEVKYDKKGNAKVAIDNIEQGILQNGMNFKTKDYTFEVGGAGQPSVEGVESFALKMSDYVGTEIGGAYFSKDGAASTTHISIGRYERNSFTETKANGHASFLRLYYPGSTFESSLTGFFHTHPSGNFSVTDRTRASDKDVESRDKDLLLMPYLRFYILTHPINYGDKFPYKKDYTKGR